MRLLPTSWQENEREKKARKSRENPPICSLRGYLQKRENILMRERIRNVLRETTFQQSSREDQLRHLKDWFQHFGHPKMKDAQVFDDIRKELGVVYEDTTLWRAFLLDIYDREVSELKQPENALAFYGRRPLSWSRTRQGAMEYLESKWEIESISDIESGGVYVFLISAKVKGEDVLLDMAQDLPRWLNQINTSGKMIDWITSSLKDYESEEEVVALNDHPNILSCEYFRMVREKYR